MTKHKIPLGKIANILVLIGLLILSGLFAYEVLVKFMAKDTTYKRVIYENEDGIMCPAITLCFDPPLKKTIIQLYNLSTTLYGSFVEFKQDHPNTTVEQIFYESTFILGKDFKMKMSNYEYKLTELQEGNNNSIAISENEQGMVQVERIYGWPAGLCYKVLPKFKLQTKFYLFITLTFTDSLAKVNKPKKVKTFITSNSNSYGVIGGAWVEGDVYYTSISVHKAAKMGRVSLKAVGYKAHPSTSVCSKSLSYYECVGTNFLRKEHFKNCSNFCVPIIWKSIIKLVTNETFTICETFKENYCMATLMDYFFTHESRQCQESCEILKYSGKKVSDGTYYSGSNVELAILFTSANLIEYEEYLIYDWIGMIGSIGGSLGLFIGFSFRDFLTYFILFAPDYYIL